MTTIIDALVVTLGIDNKGFKSQAPAAIKQTKELETSANKASDSFKDLTKSFAGFLALLGGTVALKNFIEDFIDSNAALERFSRNIGLSVSTISAWGNAVEEVGGSAKDAQGTLDMLSKAQTELMLTGTSSLIPYFSALGVSLADVTGKARPVDEILLDLSDRFAKLPRTEANNLGRMIGIDQNTLNLLLQGRKEVELTIQRQKDYAAVTKAQAAEAVKLQKTIVDLKQEFTAFGRGLLMEAAPGIEWVLKKFREFIDWAKENREFVVDFLKIVGAGLIAIGVAALPIDLTVVAVLALAAAIALLWQDYQTWKRGGDSFVDWGIWEDRVNKVTAALKGLRSELSKLAAGTKEALAGAEDKLQGSLSKNSTYRKFDSWFTNKKDAQALSSAVSGGISSALGVKGSNSIQKYFESQGWSPAQAAGIAANIQAESNGNPNATGDNGTALGLAQWRGSRQEDFKNFSGRDLKGSSLEQQLAFIQYELTKGNYKDVGDALKRQTSGSGAASLVSRRYERPKDTEGEAGRRGTLAESLLGVKGASAPLAGATSSPGGAAPPVDQSKTLTTGDITINTQATDAEGIARDLTKSMDYLFTSQANAGLF